MDKAFGLWLIWTWRLHRFWDSNPGRCWPNWGLKHCKRKPSSSVVPGIMSLGPFKGQPVKCFPQWVTFCGVACRWFRTFCAADEESEV